MSKFGLITRSFDQIIKSYIMKKTVIKFGLRALIAGAVLFFLALWLGQDMDHKVQEVIGYSTIVVSLSFVYFGIRHFRDKENEGKLSFGKALKIGLLISVFAGIGFGLIDYLYTSVINPNFMDEYLTNSLATMEAELSPEEFAVQGEALKVQMKEYGGSGFLSILMFSTVVIVGFIISLISGSILQRK